MIETGSMPGTRTGRADWPWAASHAALTLVLVRRAVDRLTADDRLILWPDELGHKTSAFCRFSMAAACSSLTVASGLRWRVRRSKRGCICCQIPPDPLRTAAWPGWSRVDAPHFDLATTSRSHSFPFPATRRSFSRQSNSCAGAGWTGQPLWAWFLPGLPDDRIGMFVELHHVVADGTAGVAALGALLDVGSDVAPALPQP